jgi:hypothetical protein
LHEQGRAGRSAAVSKPRPLEEGDSNARVRQYMRRRASGETAADYRDVDIDVAAMLRIFRHVAGIRTTEPVRRAVTQAHGSVDDHDRRGTGQWELPCVTSHIGHVSPAAPIPCRIILGLARLRSL